MSRRSRASLAVKLKILLSRLLSKVKIFLSQLLLTPTINLFQRLGFLTSRLQPRKVADKIGVYVASNGQVSIGTLNIEQAPKPPELVGVANNLPYTGATKFVGRSVDLKRLHEKIQQKDCVAICAVAGMGGVGKTELAIQYALFQKEAYQGGICWLQARNQDIGIQVVNFVKAHLALTPPDHLDLLNQVAWCWQHWKDGDVLIVLDDVNNYAQVKPYLPPPTSRFRVLVTTRLRLFHSSERLDLDVLSLDDALSLLSSLIGFERLQEELDDAKQLCSWLGYLPLGLELVGRYLERKPDLALSEMNKRLEAKRLEQQALNQPQDDMTAQLGVAAAFELSWQELNLNAQQLGCFLSLFALSPIPWSLLDDIKLDDLEDIEKIRDDYLINFHLLQRVAKETYRLHELIREFFQGKMSKPYINTDLLRKKFSKLMVDTAQQIPEQTTLNIIKATTSAMPHISEAATVLLEYLSDEDLVWPFTGLGRFYEGQGYFELAESWYKQGLLSTEARFGKIHTSVSQSLNNLAVLYDKQGRYREAEPLLVQALELDKQLLGETHTSTATATYNLANIYRMLGRYDEAEHFFLAALSLRKQLLGSNHFELGLSLYALALFYYDRQRYSEAEPLYDQALDILTNSLGEEHPYVAFTLCKLADLHVRQGKKSQAEAQYLKAIQLLKKSLGDIHPHVATAVHSLALFYDEAQDYEQAENFYLQSLEIGKQLLGDNHPERATTLHCLGDLYKKQERYDEAESLYLKALEITKLFLGDNHPKILSICRDLASLYYHQNQYEKVEPLYLQILKLEEELSGSSSCDVAISLNSLANLYYSQGRYSDAQPLYEGAIKIFQQELGSDHPNTITVQQNLEGLIRARDNPS
jgi:tetratricopeptide (TPR) repeat protein